MRLDWHLSAQDKPKEPARTPPSRLEHAPLQSHLFPEEPRMFLSFSHVLHLPGLDGFPLVQSSTSPLPAFFIFWLGCLTCPRDFQGRRNSLFSRDT